MNGGVDDEGVDDDDREQCCGLRDLTYGACGCPTTDPTPNPFRR